MTPERWRQITEIFHAAIAHDPARRDTFLAEACGDDPGLRTDVESLMAAHRNADGFGDAPVFVPLPPLEAGTALGPYRIEALLGAGGMGEVYRARDPKLGRDVAIKLLPPHFTSDPERVARFEREARLLAALNHAHIGAIYGLEHAGGVMGLVLELVEGPTLADRLARGRLPIDDALKIARQIAEALEAAHEHGIIHRDLKPANIGITRSGAVKVLDFGLAKAGLGESSAAVHDQSPTLTVTTAREGLLLGTAAYMSPEQARGKPLDKRSDIWAFGCVLYEMLTGRPAFEGETVSDTIARVLEHEPAWNALPADVPPLIRRLLKRCLKRDPSERLHDIADARLEIVDALSAPADPARSASTATGRRWLFMAAALAAILAVIVSLARMYLTRPSLGPALLEFPINLPTNAGNAGFGLAVSPDGRRVAYATCCGGPQIWLHSLDTADTRPIPGTDLAGAPFWSPDSSNIGFFVNEKLMRVDLAGGSPVVVADVIGGRRGAETSGSWNADGVIVFSARAKLFRVSAAGGTPVPLEIVDDSGDGARSSPQFLSDNTHFIYYTTGHRGGATYLASLDSKQAKHLLDSDSFATYAAPSHLIFLRGTALMAQVLSLQTENLEGPALLVASNAAPGYICGCHFASASANGVLAFVKTDGGSPGHLAWFDRTGKALSLVDQPGSVEYLNPALSPDGEQIAVNRLDHQTGNWDIWTVDVARGNASRVTFDPARDSDPVWSPDGKEIVFVSNRGGQFGLYRTAAGRSGSEERLIRFEEHIYDAAPTDWSPDGKFVLYQVSTDAHPRWVVWALPLYGDRKPVAILQSGFAQYGARLSPDGKWIAYISFETGVPEVYIDRFVAAGEKKQISRGGGVHPRWTRGGRELVYWSDPGRGGVGAVDLEFTATGLRASIPRTLISTPILNLIDGRPHYDVTRDGQRFLLRQPAGPQQPAITMIVNWMEKLKK